MKSLVQFILEYNTFQYSLENPYNIGYINLDTSWSEQKLKDAIYNGLMDAWHTFITVRVAYLEDYNKKKQEKNDKDLFELMQKEEKYWLEYKKSKPGILRRSPQKQQEWLDNKLQEYKKKLESGKSWQWRKFIPVDSSETPDKLGLTYNWYYDVNGLNLGAHQTNIKEDKMIDILNTIVKRIKTYKDDIWSKLIGLEIKCSDFIPGWDKKSYVFNIYPKFDEETQKEFDATRKKVADSVRGYYDSKPSGGYVGD